MNNSQAAVAARELGVDEVWAGEIQRVLAPRPKTTYTDHEDTQKIKVGTKEVTKDNGKTKTENVYEDQKYFYRTFKKTVTGQMSGTFKYLDVERGQTNAAQSWTERYNDDTSWNVYRGGSRKAWDKSRKGSVEQQLATPNERVATMIGQAARRLSNTIKQRESRVVIPVIQTLSEAGN